MVIKEISTEGSVKFFFSTVKSLQKRLSLSGLDNHMVQPLLHVSLMSFFMKCSPQDKPMDPNMVQPQTLNMKSY